MEPGFWKQAWDDGRIAFHEGKPNELLVRFAAKLEGARRVLVPLCGKAEDLAWLAAQGHEVVGVELVEDAVRAFFEEHSITPTTRRAAEGVTAYSAGSVTIFAGDFFAVTREMVGDVAGVYDRAAMVALPAALRARYVPHLRTLAAPGSRVLLVTLDYPEGARQGPPFAVTDAEVRAVYASATDLELLSERPDPRGEIGGTTMTERGYAFRL